MMDLYDAYDPGLVGLARSARVKPWWHAYGITSRGYYNLEEEAASVREWQLALVPGLFQTQEYARALFIGAGRVAPEQIPNAVAARMRRKQRLAEMSYEAIIDERSLRRAVGGRDVKRCRLHELCTFAELDTVTIRVRPAEADVPLGLDGSFSLLRYDDPDEPEGLDILYVEHVAGSVHFEKDEAVQQATRTFERLREEALSVGDSVRPIRALAEEWSTSTALADR